MTFPRLLPYYCSGKNPHTGRPCLRKLLEAWAASGALVRRRCDQCGLWQVVEVEASGMPVKESETLLVLR